MQKSDSSADGPKFREHKISRTSPRRIIMFDLSQPVQNGMTIFPGDVVPEISPADYVPAPWRVASLHLGTHTGTHIDAPSHLLPDGLTIDQFDLHRFFVPGAVVLALDLDDDQPIGTDLLSGALSVLPKGGGIVIRTDWSRFWGTERYMRHPYLTPEATEALVTAGVSVVGIDALNVDSTAQYTTHVHEILLGNGVLIVENLAGLGQLEPETVYAFSFLPLYLPGLDASPVRAVAMEWPRIQQGLQKTVL
jgi:arylformamidase